jgi:hypothetical protein
MWPRSAAWPPPALHQRRQARTATEICRPCHKTSQSPSSAGSRNLAAAANIVACPPPHRSREHLPAPLRPPCATGVFCPVSPDAAHCPLRHPCPLPPPAPAPCRLSPAAQNPAPRRSTCRRGLPFRSRPSQSRQDRFLPPRQQNCGGSARPGGGKPPFCWREGKNLSGTAVTGGAGPVFRSGEPRSNFLFPPSSGSPPGSFLLLSSLVCLPFFFCFCLSAPPATAARPTAAI